MNKELQDRAWAALPKEFRDEIKEFYTIEVKTDIGKGFRKALETFGRHNLTSDTEPEDVLCVSVPKAVERIRYLKGHPKEHSVNEAMARADELLSFLGDKCLPDTAVAKNATVASEATQKYQFKVGDMVRVIDTGDVASVKELLYGTYRLDLDDVAGDIWYREEEIEAYDATKNNPLLTEFKGIVDGFASVQDKLRAVYSRLAKKAALVEKRLSEED